MRVRLSSAAKGVLGIVGHAGCGHAHGTGGFIQDDSVGLAVTLALLQEALDIPLTIASVAVTSGAQGMFEVHTVSGGVGRCTARRGITLQEGRLAQAVVGQEAIRTHALAMDAFGRVYGQGAHEPSVALQTAIANAAMDSCVKAHPQRFHAAEEGLAGNCGRIIGTVLDVDGVPVSLMALSNATEGGIGPNEDLEGNICLLGKKTVMEPLDLHRLPSFVVEGKAFIPALCAALSEPTFMVRASADDNTVAAQALTEAMTSLGYAFVYPPEALKRAPDSLLGVTNAAADTIVSFGEQLRQASTSAKKVALIADLITFASQDAGGVTFMSAKMHELANGPGVMPGTSAVLSLLMPKSYVDSHVMPYLTEHDVARYAKVLKRAVGLLHAQLPQASECLAQRAYTGNVDERIR